MKLFDLFQGIMDGKSFETEYNIAPYWRPTSESYVLDLASNAVNDAEDYNSGDRNIDVEFIRIRKDTIRVNDIEVPAPMTTEPKVGQVVYVPDYVSDCGYLACCWGGGTLQMVALKRGLVYEKSEDALDRAKTMFNM